MDVKEFDREAYRVKFRSVFALMAFLLGMGLLYAVIFYEPAGNSKLAEYIVGFITGSMLSSVIGFYFGATDKKETIVNPTNPEEPEEK